MKLVINAISTKPGGGLTVLITLLRGWRRLGIDLHITVLASNTRTIEALERSDAVDEIVPLLIGAPSWKFYWWEVNSLHRMLRDLGADLVMRSNHFLFNVPCPQVVLHQNLWRFDPPKPALPPAGGFVEGVRSWTARKALKSAAANVFISQYLRDCAERIVPESSPRNYVIYNSIDDSVLERTAELPSSYDGSATIAAVQDGNIQKDNVTLVKMLGDLVQKEPQVDWRLKVAGGTGRGRFGDDFIQLARQLGVADRIDWLGFQTQSQIDTLLRNSLCLAFTSVVEGFGLPPLEAMARRCPVVACNATAMPEVIHAAGILVEPRNSGQFADAVIKCYRDPDLRRSLIERGFERAKDFPATSAARQFCDVFEHVTGLPIKRREPASMAAQHEV